MIKDSFTAKCWNESFVILYKLNDSNNIDLYMTQAPYKFSIKNFLKYTLVIGAISLIMDMYLGEINFIRIIIFSIIIGLVFELVGRRLLRTLQ